MGSCDFCDKGGTSERPGEFYTCPKCNAPYCSLKCYRSPDHIQCTEAFYKQCVQEEMKAISAAQNSNDKAGAEARQRTVEALKRQLNEDVEGEEGELDSDDETDLSQRLAGVDLEDSQAVWQSLTESERSEFQDLLKSGDIERYVPDFRPWWDHYYTGPGKKIVELEVSQRESNEFAQQVLNRIPALPEDFPPPLPENIKLSPNIKFGLLNVVYAYAFTQRLYRGSVDPETDQENANEFPGVLWSICGNLSKNQNFDSADLAVQSAISCVVEENGTLLQTSAEKAKEVRGDVIKIVRGPGNDLPGVEDNLYLKSALSDLIRTLKRCVKAQRQTQTTPTKKEVKMAVKKLEFYLSWVDQHYHLLTTPN